MPEHRSYTAYYKPVPLRFWFYFWCVLLIAVIIFNVIRLIWPPAYVADWENFLTPIAHLFVFYSTAERIYKQYKNSKIKNCFITVDEDGIKWRLHQPSYHVKEAEVIMWSDVKKVVIDKSGITIKYLSTYFSDTIPLEKIPEENQQLLLQALINQIQDRSIPSENRMAA